VVPLRHAEELRGLRSRPRRLLAVCAHPDDEAYGPAGALARAGFADDAAAVLLTLTRGEASKIGPERGLSTPEVAGLRERRLVEVAALLELDGLVVRGLPDGGLARFDFGALSASIAEVLRALEPQVVIGPDPLGVNAHRDHVATHWALRQALRDAPARRFAMTAYPPEVAELAKPRLLFPTPLREIDAVLRLDERETDAKEACLRVHEAFVTLRDGGDPGWIRRPPIEQYDFLGESFDPPLPDLFAEL